VEKEHEKKEHHGGAHTREVHHEVVKHRDGSMHHHHYHVLGHEKRAKGGRVPGDDESVKEVKPYTAPGTNVEKEAEERKHGGRVKKRADGGKVHGEEPKHRLDRRARGGRTGSDAEPFTSARHLKEPEGHKMQHDKNDENSKD
jgi:hypothetical protein